MITQMTNRARAAARGLLLITPCALGYAACGSDDAEPKTTGETPAPGTGAATPGNTDASAVNPSSTTQTQNTPPLFAVFTSIETEESESAYLTLTESLDTATELNTKIGLEAPGGSRFYAPEGGGFFAIGGNDDYTITRYDVTEDKKFKEAGKVSFAGLGVTRLQHRNVFASETKAYYIDATGGQIIIWNPKSMLVDRSVKLPPQATDGFEGNRAILPYYQFPFVDGKIFIPVSWLNSEAGTARNVTGLVVFDTKTETLLPYTETDRCPAATELAFAANGDVYYGTNVNQPYYGNGTNPAKRATDRSSCILRILAGQTSFDPNYTLKIADIAGGRVGMSLANAAEPGFGYIQVLNESITPWSSITDDDKYWESEAWEWWQIDLAKKTASVDKGLPTGTPFIKTFETNKHRYVVQQKGDGKSQIFQLSADGNHKPGLIAPGSVDGIARVR